MLQITDLTLTHRRDLRTLVEHFSFVLNSGDKAAIIGEEGNGKSTILKWIFDPALIDHYCQCSGRCSAPGHSIGYLAQQLTEEEKGLSIYDFCARSQDFGEQDYRELADVARQLQFPVEEYYSDRLVGTLSGGEQIKLQLSRLLFSRADVLLLDEPSSDIDLETLKWLEKFIRSYQGIILYVSHDEMLLENTANVILHIEHPREGKPPRCTVSRIGYGEYVSRRGLAIAYQEQQARKEREEYDKKMEKFRRIQQSVEHAQNNVSRQDPSTGRLLKKKMHTVQSMGRRFQREAENMTEMPQVEEAVFLRFNPGISLPAGKTVLDYRLKELRTGERLLSQNIHLRVMGGEKIGIMGRNGAGKTTLLRLLARELLARKDLKAAYMPQNYSDTLPMDALPLDYLAPSGEREDRERASTFLGSIRFAREEMFHTIGELSGGQKAKLLLTKMMLDDVNVLILDEPTRNFSPLSGPRVRRVLQSYGGSILAVSHDRKFLAEVCDKVYSLTENGLELVDKEVLIK